MKKMFKPKFKIGDVVQMKDEYHFNPANKVTSIGCIQAIHLFRGESLGAKRTKDGTFKCEDYKGRITYTISGFSLMPEEKDLQLFTDDFDAPDAPYENGHW